MEALLQALEARVEAAEMRANEAEERTRGFEDEIAEGESRFRHRLGLNVGRKLGRAAGRRRGARSRRPRWISGPRSRGASVRR